MILCLADRAVGIHRMCDVGADVGIGKCQRSIGEYIRIFEGVDPVLPVFTAHYLDGSLYLLVCCRGDGDIADHTVFEVDGLVGVSVSDGFQDGRVGRAVGGGAARSGKTVDH